MEEKRGGVENLRVPTSEEARANGQKGGIASGESRRRAASMAEAARRLLAASVTVEDLDGVVREMTAAEAITLAQLKKAYAGDRRAAEFVRDTGGEKPAARVEISGTDPSAAAAVEAIIKGENA